MMDALIDIVSRTRIMGRIDFHAALKKEDGFRFPENYAEARYHIIVNGECWARFDNEQTPLHLTAVSLLVIPRGAAHSIAASTNAQIRDYAPIDMREHKTTHASTGRNERADYSNANLVMSGVFEMDPNFGQLLLNELPEHLHIPLGNGDDMNWLGDALRFVAHEVVEGAPGSTAVADRMGEIMFMETIKSFAETAAAGVLASLRDPKIGAALNAFHRAPADEWTVAKLATEASLSRSVFAERASLLLGIPPMQYVKEWRLMLARQMIDEGIHDIEKVARQVGYSSIEAFEKAFRDYYGEEVNEALNRNA